MNDPDPYRLTEWTDCGGCAAKWGASVLGDLIGEFAAGSAARSDADSSGGEGSSVGSSVAEGLLIGLSPFDDAAVYRLTDDLALVSTTDFFPPVVDSPYDFGAVAAANACSDIFAMGARVVVALNLAAFPETMPVEVIGEVLRGAGDTVQAAGGSIGGGHTIRSVEPIFGLAVQGVVHPERILAKSGARVGDVLMLSKPIGTGLVLAGGDDQAVAAVITGMRSLNRSASEALVGAAPHVHAATDVTGFGLAGHAWELADRSGVCLRIDSASVPTYPQARGLASAGTRTGGDARNREYVADHVRIDGADDGGVALCMDPQTSGGLLAAVDQSVVGMLADAGFTQIGSVMEADRVGAAPGGPIRPEPTVTLT